MDADAPQRGTSYGPAGPTELDQALTLALEAAAAAGDLALVGHIVAELRTRREVAAPNVVALSSAKKSRR